MNRTTYELRPRTVLDLRHYGAVEIRTRVMYHAFLTTLRANEERSEGRPLITDGMDGFPGVLVNAARVLHEKRTSSNLTTRKLAEYAYTKFLREARQVIAYKVCESLGSQAWCDTTEARRMGTGDLIVEMGICQRIAEHTGTDGLLIIYDPFYPQSSDIWNASGLNTLPILSTDDVTSAQIRAVTGWNDWQFISFRNHTQEAHAGGQPEYNYAQEVGYPGALMLYELGWEKLIDWQPVQFSLTADDAARSEARRFLNGNIGARYVTLQPIERSRENEHSTPELWKKTLAMMLPHIDHETIIIGCTPEEAGLLPAVLPADVMARALVANVGLMAWFDIIQGGVHHFSANNCGLWLGLSSTTPMTVVDGVGDTDRSDALELSMWSPKPEWFTGEGRDERSITVV